MWACIICSGFSAALLLRLLKRYFKSPSPLHSLRTRLKLLYLWRISFVKLMLFPFFRGCGVNSLRLVGLSRLRNLVSETQGTEMCSGDPSKSDPLQLTNSKVSYHIKQRVDGNWFDILNTECIQ
jgi:hypothetical protein